MCVAFKYMTPKLRLDHQDLVDTPLLWSKSFHLICSPLRSMELAGQILRLRMTAVSQNLDPRPLTIWEPVPDLCVPGEYGNCLRALRHVDVVSPNNGELGGFFGIDTMDGDHVNFRLVESLCDIWLRSGVGPRGEGGIVVRCGKDGCLVMRRGLRKWMPAYHQSSEKVVDPTGGGNGFLGGLAVGLVRGSDEAGVQVLEEAAAWGSVTASFAIEQVGMPVLEKTENGETWNGVSAEDRLAGFKQRLKGYVQP
jgi:sugar/nucleoside kinase (ribokinase family)